MEKFSFKNVWEEVPVKTQKEIKNTIVRALGISQSTFYRRVRGEIEPKISEVALYKTTFLQHGFEFRFD